MKSETHVGAAYHSTAGYQANTVKELMFVYFFICVDVLLIVVCKTRFSLHVVFTVFHIREIKCGHQYF